MSTAVAGLPHSGGLEVVWGQLGLRTQRFIISLMFRQNRPFQYFLKVPVLGFFLHIFILVPDSSVCGQSGEHLHSPDYRRNTII